MPTHILKICVCWRSSSNILKTLALGWDSFGFEYKIRIVCWLLVTLEKPKSCHVSKLSVSTSSFQVVTTVPLQKALLALVLQTFRKKTLPISWTAQWVSMSKYLDTNYMQLPAIPKDRKKHLRSLNVPITAYFTPLWSVLSKLFHASHNFF